MAKNFNDLFNEFFGEDNKPEKPMKNVGDIIKDLFINKQESKNNKEEDINNLINMLSEFTDLNEESSAISEQLDDKLGEPDEINRYTDGHLYYEEKIWENEEGRIIKTSVSDEPFEGQKYEYKSHEEMDEHFTFDEYTEIFDDSLAEIPVEKTLEEQLEEAIENEEYEEAARIRDLMNKNKKSRKKV